MALKRKLSQDFDDAAYTAVRPTAKKVQTSFVYSVEAFPSSDSSDMDVDMDDGSSNPELSPLNIPDHPFHTRLVSDASSTGSYLESPRTSPSYPAFDLYPHNPNTMSIDDADYFNCPANSSPRVGLMQPKGTGFTHHGQNCSQIPKLRMACSSGPNGQRTMWAHCEECGAIEMVDTD
ncbi:hypothetical protein BXZ70DRAFT_16615 [Cristinia sonorae]|uniref:Uncharacterized protein n=1 Tax=Cristinia sonorae TaxID=1940300 RepID=A0A8K0XUM8_9AGAR|nr:hypothetical protein BXZ70DRAFT_16615 [Cristinia sonorae]